MTLLSEAYQRAIEKRGKSGQPAKIIKIFPEKKETNEARAPQSSLWSYTPIAEFSEVKVAIPKESPNLTFVPAHCFESTTGIIAVEDHWKFGTLVEGKIYVNRKFFIPIEMAGKKMNMKIIVWEKTKDNKKYVFIDHFPQPNLKAKSVLKFVEDGDIAIPGSKTMIKVEPV